MGINYLHAREDDYAAVEIDLDCERRFAARIKVEGGWWYATGNRADASSGYRHQIDQRVAEYADDAGNVLWADRDGTPVRGWRRHDEEWEAP
jgi:hypothetical protein